MVEPDWVRIASDWVQYLATGAVGGISAVWVGSRRRDAARREQIDTLTGRLAEHDRLLVQMEANAHSAPTGSACQAHLQRLTRLEAAQEHAPSQDGLKRVEERIHARIDSIAQGLAEVRGEVHASTGLLRTIDQYLRDHPRP